WTHATCCPSGEMAVWSMIFKEKSVEITSLRGGAGCCWPRQRVQINMTKKICLGSLIIQVSLCELCCCENLCRPHARAHNLLFIAYPQLALWARRISPASLA